MYSGSSLYMEVRESKIGSIYCYTLCVIIIHDVIIIRKRRASENGKDQSPSELYENPDYLNGANQGNYEMTHCPAYGSAAF